MTSDFSRESDSEKVARLRELILASFEERSDFLEDVPVADTVLVPQALAAARGRAVELPASILLVDASRTAE